MDTSKRICRFCYNLYEEKNMTQIQERQINMMKALSITMDLSICEQPSICTLCLRQLEDCDNFKKLCISTEKSIKPYTEDNIKINLNLIYKIMLPDSEKDNNICRLCMQPTDHQYVLNIVEKEQFLQYFSEINLNITSSIVFCLKCHSSLHKQFQFLKFRKEKEKKLEEIKQTVSQSANVTLEQCLKYFNLHNTKKEMEYAGIEPVKIYVKQERINEGGRIIAISLKQEPVFVKEENMDAYWEETYTQSKTLQEIQIQEEMNQGEETMGSSWDKAIPKDEVLEEISTKKDVKEEEIDTKLVLPNDDLDINDETGDEDLRYVSNQVAQRSDKKYSISNKIQTSESTAKDDIQKLRCKECNYKSAKKYLLQRHIHYNHSDPSKMKVHKCRECSYESKTKTHLRNHILMKHTDSSQIDMYKCTKCDYMCKLKRYLQKHIFWKHTDSSEIEMYKCNECTYECKTKTLLKKHSYIHTDSSKIAIYQCQQCSYESKFKQYIELHILHKHTDPSETTMHKCEQCDYRCKVKHQLKKHVLYRHTDTSFIKMFKCDKCPYESKGKGELQRHILGKHTDRSQVELYKCDQCKYECKYKSSLKTHIFSKHSAVSLMKKYKCERCNYRTRFGKELERHLSMNHMEEDQCEESHSMKKSEVKMYKCDQCDYEYKHKSSLKTHIFYKHTDVSLIRMYKCEECDYQSKFPNGLQEHVLVKHTDTSKVEMFSCDRCNYQSKLKKNLKKHALKHEYPK